MARTLSERLIHEAEQTRKELHEEIVHVTDTELDWAPQEGMRTYRGQLKELGAMQAEAMILLTEGRVPKWEEAEALILGDTVAGMLDRMDAVQARLIDYLRGKSDEDLKQTFRVPQDWELFFGDTDVELEEFVRWVARHEYYHLAQIVSYNWIRGFNPYKK